MKPNRVTMGSLQNRRREFLEEDSWENTPKQHICKEKASFLGEGHAMKYTSDGHSVSSLSKALPLSLGQNMASTMKF